MPNRLELTKNVQFYKLNNIDNDVITQILDGASSNKEVGKDFIINEFRESRITPSRVEYKLSARVYSTVKQVHFLDDDAFEDRIHAYLVLIELHEYLIVLSKSCAIFSHLLKQNFEPIKPLELSKLLSDDVEFQKMSLRNMTISDKAIRARSYEASNLIGAFSTHAAGRSIPYHLKARQGGIIKSISGTGRLVESSNRKKLDEIVEWGDQQINLLRTANPNDFLRSFARKVDLEDVLGRTRPVAILADTSEIVDKINNGIIVLKWQKIRKNNVTNRKVKITRQIDEIHISQIISILEKVYEFDQDWKVINFENTTKLKLNKRSLSISSSDKLLRKIKVEENGKLEGLITYINKKGLYSIVFEDPKFMYFRDNCFEDRSGISEIDSILDILHPKSGIENVKSEKGTFTSNAVVFDNDSMFGFVENLIAHDDYIFCDDLGNEWADHISLNLVDPSINFIHSKHGIPSTSASNLHDVVGQGIKNLGNMFFTEDQLLTKLNGSWMSNYTSGSGTKTQISRIRKSNMDLNQDLKDLLKDYKLHRKCILSCSFISKAEIATEFLKLKNQQQVNGHIIQLLWILSSFAHSAKEANVIPMIYCAA